jgi:hypothetical protein
MSEILQQHGTGFSKRGFAVSNALVPASDQQCVAETA